MSYPGLYARLLKRWLVGWLLDLFGLSFETEDKFNTGSNIALALLYIVGRFVLLVEIFRTLLFLPPDAFVTTSASNIPHVS